MRRCHEAELSSDSMQILLLTHYFEPENGAPQRRWSALIDRFVAAGHSVSVLAPPPHYPTGRLTAEGVALQPGTLRRNGSGALVYRVRYLRHRGDIVTRTLDHIVAALDSYRCAVRMLPHRHADVVIATAPALESLVVGWLIARRFSLPLVAEMRDAWPDLVAHTPGLVSHGHPTTILKRRVHGFVTRLQRTAAAVVTTTSTFATVLRERGIEEVTVLRNGTEMRRYEHVKDTPYNPHSTLRVLYMGTIGRSQGLDRLIAAAARLVASGVPLDVRIVGHGADVGRLRKMNSRLGRPVQILGQVEGAAVGEHYKWADTTVVSLRDWAPFAWTVPSKLYELLAAGKHITAIVEGEAAEIVRETGAGHVVAPGDVEGLVALWRRVAKDRALLQVGENGRRWVAQHADYDKIAADYLALLERVVNFRH